MGSCPLTNCCNAACQNPSTQGKPWAGTAPRLMTNVSRKPTRLTAAHLNYFQVVRLISFQKEYPTLSLTAPIVGGVMPYPPSGTGTSLTAIEITENLTSAPKSAKPTALGGGNCISNLTPLMGLEVQEFPTDTDSDATLAGISGANENNSTYLGPR